jgi:tetratricopeptide (TPR) repeat protein
VFRIAALAAAILVAAPVGSAAQIVVKRPVGSAARAADWVDAVLQHQPGRRDAAVGLVSSWPADVINELPTELNSIRRLMRQPRTRYFPIELPSGRISEISYSGDERDALDQAGLRALRNGLDDTDLLARAIVLHSDIALLENLTGDMLWFTDGQHMDLARGGVDHLRLARVLGDELDSKSGRKPDLALWYRGTIATLALRNKWNTVHSTHALSLFPDDGELRFLVGCQHETFASARTQASIPNTPLPPGMSIPVGSPSRELNQAASDLKRAVDANPANVEAHLHYGRVLTLVGRPAAAIAELRAAARAARDPILRYYAELFLGAALEADGQRDAALDAYRAAAGIFPTAQAPRLAASQIAAASGARAEALAALAPVLALSADEDRRGDPWWSYFNSYAHDANALLAQALERLATPRRQAGR